MMKSNKILDGNVEEAAVQYILQKYFISENS